MSRILLAAAGLLVSTAAAAQAGPVAEKSSDQIVCEMTGDCDKADASLATQDKPESRGFSIARPKAAGTVATPPQQVTRNRVVPADNRRVAATAPGRSRIATPPAAVGRSELAINFHSGSATLTEGGRHQALQFLRAMGNPQLSGKRFQVAGHTDAVGTRAYNIDLSKRRAQAVVDFLVQNGASPAQFDVRGYGFDRPAIARNPKASENRRVEFVKVD